MNTKKYRFLVEKSFWVCCGLFAVLVVASALWGTLKMLGDEAGAQGAKGVTLVALVCWGLNFLFLVSVLALAEMSRDSEKKENLESEL